MNTEKFTPGEWRFVEQDLSISDFTMFQFQILTDEYRICASRTDDPENIQTMKANCHLIAAAPEMYRKLKTVLALCEGNLLRKTRCDILGKEIEELLNKARGEE